MKKEIITITAIKEAIPRKGQWYDYFGDIFISVIPLKKKPHIRKKITELSNKKDSSTSPWHLIWQYEIIEAMYGISAGSTKTYERIVYHNNQKHIIDSLVDGKVAIEFQHTLSVDLEEMNERCLAHTALGFRPYLVLDLTDYTVSQYRRKDNRLINKLERWLTSEYYINDGLFIDLQDAVLWLSTKFYHQYHKLEPPTFQKLILHLPVKMHEVITRESLERIQRNERSARKAEERAISQKEGRIQVNQVEKRTGEEYKYFRKCFNDPILKRRISARENDLFNYRSYTEEEDEKYFKKFYIYESEDKDFTLKYWTVSTFKMEDVRMGRKLVSKRKFTYLCAMVELMGSGRLETYYLEPRKQTVRW